MKTVAVTKGEVHGENGRGGKTKTEGIYSVGGYPRQWWEKCKKIRLWGGVCGVNRHARKRG